MKSRNVFRVNLPGQVHNLCLISEVLEHNYILAVQ